MLALVFVFLPKSCPYRKSHYIYLGRKDYSISATNKHCVDRKHFGFKIRTSFSCIPLPVMRPEISVENFSVDSNAFFGQLEKGNMVTVWGN